MSGLSRNEGKLSRTVLGGERAGHSPPPFGVPFCTTRNAVIHRCHSWANPKPIVRRGSALPPPVPSLMHPCGRPEPSPPAMTRVRELLLS